MPVATRSGLLAACLLALPACQVVPDDHALGRSLGRSLAALRDSLDPSELAASVARSTRGLVRSVEAIDPRRDAIRLVGSGRARGDDLVDSIRGAPARIAATTGAALQGSTRRAAKLLTDPRSSLRRAADPDRAARSLRRAASRSWSALQLDRRILPGPTDPERRTDVIVSVRRESWVERVVRRLGL